MKMDVPTSQISNRQSSYCKEYLDVLSNYNWNQVLVSHTCFGTSWISVFTISKGISLQIRGITIQYSFSCINLNQPGRRNYFKWHKWQMNMKSQVLNLLRSKRFYWTSTSLLLVKPKDIYFLLTLSFEFLTTFDSCFCWICLGIHTSAISCWLFCTWLQLGEKISSFPQQQR